MRALILISVLLVGCDNEQIDKLIEENPNMNETLKTIISNPFKKDEIISLYLDCVEDYNPDVLYPRKITLAIDINLNDETGTMFDDWMETTHNLTEISEMFFYFGERTYVNRVSRQLYIYGSFHSCTERQRL